MNCFATTKCRTPPGDVQQRISPLAIPLAHVSSFAGSQPLPRRVHVCVSVCRMGTGAVPPEGWGPGNVTGSVAQSAAVSRPRRWYWGSEGAVLYNAVFGSQRGRKKPSWRKAPSPPPGPGHRVPGAGSFPPPAVAGRFVSPASALRATREGLPPGLHRERGGRKGGRPRRGLAGTQESGRREGRVTRSRRDPELCRPGVRAGGVREQRPPRRGGAMFPSPAGSSGSQGILPLGPAPPQWATPQAIPWRLCARLPASQCQRPREGRPAPPHP